MISKDSKISLSYTLAGESLVKAGVYQEADVYVKNEFQKNEIFKINKPMKTIQRAEYEKATCTTMLGNSFVQMALEQPKRPEGMNYHRWLRTPLGRIASIWKKMTDEQKIKFHVEQYVISMNGDGFEYEIL